MDKEFYLEEVVYTLEDVSVKASKLEAHSEDCYSEELLMALAEIEDGIKAASLHIRKLKRKLKRDSSEI